MHEEGVGKTGEAVERVLVVDGQRLVREVPAGQDDGSPQVRHEQVMERRVREEESHAPVTAGDARGQRWPGVRSQADEDDGSSGRGEQRSLTGPHLRECLRRGEVPHHDRERLGPAPLPVAQPFHRGWVGGVAGEVVAAETLHRHDAAAHDGLDGAGQRAFADGAQGGRVAAPPAQLGSAGRAGHRLGMEAAVAGISVLRLAGRAERELAHGGLSPVVGQLLDDRGARPAVGAVDEGVAVAPVRGVPQLGQAGIARGDVGREEADAGRRCGALRDAEAGASERDRLIIAKVAHDDSLHARPRRGILAQAAREGFQVRHAARGLDLHPAGGIAHLTVEPELARQAVDEGSEADALHDAIDLEGAGNSRLRAQGTVDRPIA